jgi:hypothetical protein
MSFLGFHLNPTFKQSHLFVKSLHSELGVVAHAFNPSTWEGRGRRISEFEASLVYKMSSRTARATQRNPDLRNQKKKKEFTFWTLTPHKTLILKNIHFLCYRSDRAFLPICRPFSHVEFSFGICYLRFCWKSHYCQHMTSCLSATWRVVLRNTQVS